VPAEQIVGQVADGCHDLPPKRPGRWLMRRSAVINGA
jgi:hypothetical protein